tara:strand:- start:378 stop:683 length:306 start_codon:yes stop_codon:yes gene_type:complete
MRINLPHPHPVERNFSNKSELSQKKEEAFLSLHSCIIRGDANLKREQFSKFLRSFSSEEFRDAVGCGGGVVESKIWGANAPSTLPLGPPTALPFDVCRHPM